MFREIDRVLISRDRIAARVHELAEAIARDLTAELEREGSSINDEGRIVIVPILTGSIVFVADLIRELPMKLSLDLVTVSSYPGASIKTKGAQLATEMPRSLGAKHVLVIDDILDSGQTLNLVRGLIQQQKPASLRFAVLLDKKERREADIDADYVGFQIPDEFVVGYGLDYNGYYRNHPEIAILRSEALASADDSGRAGSRTPKG
ncbi:MAG: hypoxanthine phosphoribosyltransferase [Phycisphaerales bacterium]